MLADVGILPSFAHICAMRFPLFPAVSVVLATATVPAASQTAPLAEGAGNRPVEQVVAREKLPAPSPRLFAFTDDAGIGAVGWLGFEAGYQAAFVRCFGGPDDPFFLEEERCALHTPTGLVTFAPTEFLEARIGLQAFASTGYPAPIGADRQNLVDRVDVFAEVKGSIPLDVAEPDLHRLAVLVTGRPGAGQSWPADRTGELAAYAVYSTRPGPVLVDVQAGVRFRGLFTNAIVSMPLSAVVAWRANQWVQPFGELIEELEFRDLSASGTSLRLGSLFWAEERLAFSIGTQIGLSEHLPDATIEFGLTALGPRILR